MNFTRDAISGGEGIYWLQVIRAVDPETMVVFITAYGDVKMAVRAMKAGATDFILKPWRNEQLLDIIAGAISQRQAEPTL